ncbi:MAG: selenide, water dikinase SelD, partial [Armatimonadota bacterium]|nr:selenide, water dikinase SelD [Armatimonadota bacterium]
MPVRSQAADLVRAGAVAGGTVRNPEFPADRVQFDEAIPDEVCILLADAQTSGGLPMAVSGS